MAPPVTAIVGDDLCFHDHLPSLFTCAKAHIVYIGDDERIRTTALRNGTART